MHTPQGWKNLDFFKKKFLGFKIFKVFLKVLMYEDRSQNYNLEIHEEYLISHAWYTPPPYTWFIVMCRL